MGYRLDRTLASLFLLGGRRAGNHVTRHAEDGEQTPAAQAPGSAAIRRIHAWRPPAPHAVVGVHPVHDPQKRAADLQHLRHLHQTLDEQVCLAYGWSDLASTVPPYGAGHAESAATLAWQAQVLERLWGLKWG